MIDFNALVDLERGKQDQKWGVQNHSPLGWLGILMEEVGEVSTEAMVIEGITPPKHIAQIGHEIVQVAAVCKVMYESLERNGWL